MSNFSHKKINVCVKKIKTALDTERIVRPKFKSNFDGIAENSTVEYVLKH